MAKVASDLPTLVQVAIVYFLDNNSSVTVCPGLARKVLAWTSGPGVMIKILPFTLKIL